MDDRRKDEVTALRQAVKDSNVSLEALSSALMQFAFHAEERTVEVEALVNEVEALVNRHRRLGKYTRRTHFWTMAMMIFAALFLADLSQHANSAWWDLLFWARNHGRGDTLDYVLRGLGFAWQSTYLFYLVKIAQVPDDLWPDVAAAQLARERKTKRFRLS